MYDIVRIGDKVDSGEAELTGRHMGPLPSPDLELHHRNNAPILLPQNANRNVALIYPVWL